METSVILENNLKLYKDAKHTEYKELTNDTKTEIIYGYLPIKNEVLQPT